VPAHEMSRVVSSFFRKLIRLLNPGSLGGLRLEFLTF
jgi:hypothetical protein